MFRKSVIAAGLGRLLGFRRAFLFDVAAGTGAAGSSSAGGAGTTGTASPTSGEGAAGAAGSAAAAGTAGAPTGAATAGKTFTQAEYDAAIKRTETEARRGYLPAHRLSEEKSKYELALDAERARVRALVGLETLSPEDAETQKVQQGLFKMFPWMERLSKLEPEKFERVLQSAELADEVTRSHWDNHASRTFDAAADQIAELLGVDELSERQFNRVVSEFRLFAKEAGTADPEGFRKRYEAGDPAIITEFVKLYTEDVIDPVRRRAVTPVINRPRVPSGGGRAPVVRQEPEKTPKDLNEAEDAAVEYMKRNGGFRAQVGA